MLDILTQSTQQMAWWKARIEQAVGCNVSLIVDIFPSLLQVIGPQPPVPPLPPSEAQQRLYLAVTAFLCCFCSSTRPLLVFYDDVQWADDISLHELAQCALHPDCQHVLIILAYREEEVDEQHPLTATLDKIKAGGKPVQAIRCGPLSQEQMQEMVVDTLHCCPANAVTLATVLAQQSHGNPFFARQLLLQLHRDKLITYNVYEEESGRGTSRRRVALQPLRLHCSTRAEHERVRRP